MKIIAVTQARIGSTRLPGKVLKTIGDVSLLQIHLERVLRSKLINKLIVATTHESGVEEICRIAHNLNADTYCGDTNNVLDRFYQSVKDIKPDYVVRVTSDCPLIDPEIVDDVIHFATVNKLDYASNTLLATYPDGMDVEVFTFKALEKAWLEAVLSSDKEHVTPYIWRNSTFKGGQLFRSDNVQSDLGYGSLRLTVDEPADFELITRLIASFGTRASWKTYARFVSQEPTLRQINEHITPNEGYLKSLHNDNI
ncbi:cytidylyltransferase domain-containing protein [Chitinophaga arvensicola]|uniref:Spore coat polysaccharide biosynthesis protein SpsF n=1 Tax=Chitinophaga arvensicola TaxID=29529 RepID=A0A1I0NPX6_9BACT|nr:glycosyltransferase family protein [Chitinophaga arvensicola]SEW03474.1 spore coat polysaccharide biosynthesis protein SpsF [Chitinophaga arvensicola]